MATPTQSSASVVDTLLERRIWQSAVFATAPRRSQLMALPAGSQTRSIDVHVIRNEAFELVGNALAPFLAFSGLSAQFHYGAYDDSLSESSLAAAIGADLVVISLDFDRFEGMSSNQLLADWLVSRVMALREHTAAPVLITNADNPDRRSALNVLLSAILSQIPGVFIGDRGAVAEELGASYRDERLQALAGSSLSGGAILRLAQMYGLCWLPAVLLPPLKAIVVDFDDTLYAGILGEVGAGNVVITAEHRALHQALARARQRGIFIAAATRNDHDDVVELLSTRDDLELTIEDFSSIEAGWGSKADSIARILDRLRIGDDAVLFVDDNAAQLAEAKDRFGGLHCLEASDPAITAFAVAHYPGLCRLTSSTTDALRVDDLAATGERERELREAGKHSAARARDYLASLATTVRVEIDPSSEVTRLADMSARFNQFNTTLSRFSETDVAAYIESADRCVVAVSLSDRLTESGLVAAFFATLEGPLAVFDEIDVSCRALGRGYDHRLVVEGISAAVAQLGATAAEIVFRAGPKNDLARDILEELVGPLPDAGRVAWRPSAQRLAEITQEAPATIDLAE